MMLTKQNRNNDLGQMTLAEHLSELRVKLIKSLIAIGVLFLLLYPFANEIYLWLAMPIQDQLANNQQMIATDITTTFFAPFKLTFVAALLLAMPFLLNQIWLFIAPGLYQHERQLIHLLLVSSTLLFYLGMTFAYWIVFPLLMAFFTTIGPDGIQLMPDIYQYLTISLKLLFAFGLAFEIPVIVFILIKTNVVTSKQLQQQRPYILILCFTIGMLLTPPDIISQTLLAIPMWLLFEVGLLLSSFTSKKWAKVSEKA